MSTSGPSTTVLNGIDVKFPFEPYQIQKGYMGQVIRSLKLKKHALLESPTGTGKTLSILCASLSWLNSVNKAKAQKEADEFKDDFFQDKAGSKDKEEESDELIGTRIYFSSRTHSQLSQSIKELKKTNYENNTAIVLAGRDLLCLNEDVNKLDNIGAKNQACKSKTNRSNCNCKYYKDYEQRVRDTRDYKESRVIDVEDLVAFGKKHSVCPYFASKYLQKRSEVIFLPYNYLLDPKIRRAQKIDLNDDVVIFDEGHNIEKTCEESVSVDLRSDHLATCIREMGNIYQFYNQSMANEIMDTQVMDAVKDFSVDDLLLLKMTLDNFEMAIDSRVKILDGQVKKSFEKKGDVCEPDWIFKVLSELSLSFDNVRKLCEICDKLQAFLTCILPVKGPIAIAASSSLNSFKDFLSVLAPDPEEDSNAFKNEFKKKFRVYIEVIEPDEKKSNTQASQQPHPNRAAGTMSNWLAKARQPDADPTAQKWILHIWCLSPSVGLKGLIKANVRSIILTSGTLAPLDSFEAEFDTKFECRIQNNHIISGNQMAIFPVSNSFTGTRLDSSFNNKNNIDYYKALGDTVVDICGRVPDGVLLFFSSYSVMNNSLSHWKENDRSWKIWTKLNSLKTVFLESRNRDEFNDDVIRYRDTVNSGKGCIFFAICRGKLSEGIDLGNAHSRAVILIGLPYPALKEPRVVQKRLYLDAVKHPNFSSNTWYTLQMKRALNQAIGRAIRHKNDYGCVFLLDYRFQNQIKDLSKWCAQFVRYPATYADMMLEVKRFFESNKANSSLRRQAAIAAAPVSSSQAEHDDESNENTNIGLGNLDFSLSEYSRGKKKSKGSKKRVYDSDPDDEKKKKVKQIASQKVESMFDLFQAAVSSTTDEPKAVKKERKHVTIEYDDAPRVPSAVNRPVASVVLADNTNSSDSVILVEE